MNNKKLIQLLITAVAGIWVFCLVFLISYKTAVSKPPQAATTVPVMGTVGAETTFPFTTMPTTAYTVPTVTIDGNNITAAVEVGKPQWLLDEEESKKAAEESKKAEEESKKASKEAKETTTTTKAYCPSGKQEIVNAYVDAVNRLKNTESFKVVQTNNLVTVVDEITGGSAIKSIAEKVIESNNPQGTVTYNFVNGIDDVSGYSPDHIIPPADKRASLSPEYVESASAEPGRNGSYTIKIRLGRQKQTLDTPAPGYSTITDTVNMDGLGLTSSMSITSLEIIYEEAVIEAEIDKNGNLLSTTHYTKSQGSGEGKMTFVPASMKMHGEYTGKFVISY